LKPLTPKQIELAKSADKRKGNIPDNYDSILNRTRDCFRDLQTISDLLPYFEKHSEKHTHAKSIVEQFGIEKLTPILDRTFAVTIPEGAPIDRHYMIAFDQKPSSMKIKLANHLLALSSSYLIQSFPKEQSEYLYSRIIGVITELENNLALLDTIKKLKIQIESYQEHTSNFIPTYPKMDSDRYSAICNYCRESQLGKTVEDAIIKLKHTEKCKTKEIKELTMGTIRTWYSIIPPENIRNQFEFLIF